MKLISFYQTTILLLCASLCHSAELWLYCGSLTNIVYTDIDNPLPLLTDTCFNEDLDSVFYAFGFDTTPEDETTQLIIQSYIATGRYNVFLINWKEEASSDIPILNPLVYPTKAVPNTIKVGKQFGQALDTMSNSKLNLLRTFAAGHSLGAHLVGIGGKEIKQRNKNLPRIIGLDPAGPGFDGLLSVQGLDQSSAGCVIAYHTNPGAFGTIEARGHKDIWFNCNKKYQPKCDDAALTTRDKCSHLLVCNYHAEAVLNPTNFAAAPSTSCTQWQSQDNGATAYIYVNDNTDCTGTNGNFYMSTNAQSPYGRGLAGLCADAGPVVDLDNIF